MDRVELGVDVMQFAYLSPDEASRIVGNATNNPKINVEVNIFRSTPGDDPESVLDKVEPFLSWRVNPYACAEKDDQSTLRELTSAMSQDNGAFHIETKISYYRDPDGTQVFPSDLP